jgi:hypothetical protein
MWRSLMVDIKKVKEELLKTFNDKDPEPETVAKEDPIDHILNQYFNKLSHMPKELTLDAITNSLKIGPQDKEAGRKRVKSILDKYLP